ncbi:hypothetical protein [Saccharopolyspora sp. NPDC002376]
MCNTTILTRIGLHQKALHLRDATEEGAEIEDLESARRNAIITSFRKLNLGELTSGRVAWAGFDNYAEVLGGADFWVIALRTVVSTACMVAATVVIALLMQNIPEVPREGLARRGGRRSSGRGLAARPVPATIGLDLDSKGWAR